jgi:hypothetical protein
MAEHHPEGHGIQQPPYGVQHDPHAPHGHGAVALPFSEAEWRQFRQDDLTGAKAIVGLMAGIFVVGLLLYATIAYVTAP